MIKSLLKRFASGIFILWIISIIGFWLSKQSPGDEVMDYLNIDDPRYNINSNPLELRSAYQLIAHRRGLDMPLFYFTISSGLYPDSVNQILPLDDRRALKAWIDYSKKGSASLQLYNQLHSGLYSTCNDTSHSPLTDHLCQTLNKTMKTQDLRLVQKNILSLRDTLLHSPADTRQTIFPLTVILNSCDHLLAPSAVLASNGWIPLLKWHGTHNQYHQWMTGLLSQKPLTSLVDGLNARTKIYDALKWTLLLNGLAFLLAMLFGVMIGIWSGTHHGRSIEQLVNGILFALFALPSFWLGTLFIYFLASGEWLSVFPAGGLGAYQSTGSWIGKWAIILLHLVLPVTCLALGALAYVSRQVKQSILHQLKQPYAQSLRMQGISEKTIMRRHVIRNALFPVITIIGGSIPALLSGSLIIEVIYGIPGMGRLMYSSLLARDWPVVFPMLMLVATITVLSYILTDVVYKWADPRVKTL